MMMIYDFTKNNTFLKTLYNKEIVSEIRNIKAVYVSKLISLHINAIVVCISTGEQELY